MVQTPSLRKKKEPGIGRFVWSLVGILAKHAFTGKWTVADTAVATVFVAIPMSITFLIFGALWRIKF